MDSDVSRDTLNSLFLLEGVSVMDHLSAEDQELSRPLKQVEQDLKQNPECRRRGWASTDFQKAYECLRIDYTPTRRQSESSADNNGTLLPAINIRVGVWWPKDGVYYPGTVTRRRGDFGFIEYDDGDEEWLLFNEHKFKLLIDEDGDDWLKSPAASTGAATTSSSVSTWAASPGLQKAPHGRGIVRPKKLPRQLEDGTFAKPRGRRPAGMRWDGHVGAWTPTRTRFATTDAPRKQQQQNNADARRGFVRPKVHRVSWKMGPMRCQWVVAGMTWDCRVGAWKPAASTATLDSPQQQNVPDVGKEFIRPNELLRKPNETYSVPKGHRPSGMTWDRHVGVWKPKAAAKRKLVAVKDGSASKKRKASQDNAWENDAAEQQPLTVKVVSPMDVEQPLDPRLVIKNITVALKKEEPGRSDESMHRCQNMLDKLNSIDMSMKILEDNQEIVKYVEELRAYTPLKPSPSPVKKKWRNVYNAGIETKLASVVEDWRKSAEEGNAVRVHESVSKLLQLVEHYKHFTKSFVEVHGMVDLMNTTYELLTEHEMDLTDSKKLYQIVLENVSL